MSKGEINLQGLMYSILVVGLFVSLIASFVGLNDGNYDISGFDEGQLNKYSASKNLSTVIREIEEDVDQTTVNNIAFDFFADIFNSVISPFKFAYRSFKLMIGLSTSAVGDLNLLPVFSEFLGSALTIFVIIGIVMIKFYLGRRK